MKKIIQCINPTLQSICKQAFELESLTLLIHQYLPPTYHQYCTVSSFSRGCLILAVTSPLHAAELRYLLPELRDYLRNEAQLYQLITIKIQMEPLVL